MDMQGDLLSGERAVLEHLPVPLCVVWLRAEGSSLLAASDGLCRLLGADRGALERQCGADLLQAIHPADRQAVEDACRAVRRDPTLPCRAACRVRAGAGEWVPVIGRGQARRAGGALLLYLTCAEAPDAARTQLREDECRTQDAYQRELERLRQPGENGLLAKWHCSLTENRVLEYTIADGQTPGAAAGKSYDAALAACLAGASLAEEREKLRAGMDRAELLRRFQAGETHFTFEYECRREENLPVWLSTAVSVCAVPGTEKVDCFTYTYDVTDKTLERQILSRLPLLGFDVIGLLYVQTGACRYFRIKKMRPGALYEHVEDYYASIGGDIERVVLPEQRERVREGLRISAITAGLARSEIYPFAYAITNWQGRRAQKLLQFSYLDESRRTIFFCKSDITEQYENEHRQIEALQAAKLEADRANEAKSAFLSSMSHDLRTPLNGVLGFTRFALREADPAKKQAYLEKVAASGELLLDLVNDTLELSRIESGKYVLEPEALQGREAALAVVLSVRPAAELKQITLQAEPADFPDECIWADRIKLQKIFLNLLSNAIKYTPCGGTVRACVQRLDPPQQGCSHRLVVEDTGIGMRPEFLPHLFEPFSQEKRPEAGPVGGTGLGLSIVRRIVDRMGGTIAVESTPGKGTKFTVDLPLPVLTQSAPAPGAAAAAAQLAGRCVLLCEDNYLNTEIAVHLLREEGMQVVCAENGAAGAELFAASAPGYFDAVLMDLRMPVLDGYGATAKIRGMDRPDAASVPIIAMTADAFADDIARCRAAGMNAHVAKPIRPEELLAALGGLCGRSAAAPEHPEP